LESGRGLKYPYGFGEGGRRDRNLLNGGAELREKNLLINTGEQFYKETKDYGISKTQNFRQSKKGEARN